MTSSGTNQSIGYGQFPIRCPLESSRYLASFPRYLARKMRQWLLRDDVINDVKGPDQLSVRTKHSIQGNNVQISSNSDKNCRIRITLKKIMTSALWRHRVTWRHLDHAQSIDHGQFPISCPLESSRYLDSFQIRDDVINDVIRPG